MRQYIFRLLKPCVSWRQVIGWSLAFWPHDAGFEVRILGPLCPQEGELLFSLDNTEELVRFPVWKPSQKLHWCRKACRRARLKTETPKMRLTQGPSKSYRVENRHNKSEIFGLSVGHVGGCWVISCASFTPVGVQLFLCSSRRGEGGECRQIRGWVSISSRWYRCKSFFFKCWQSWVFDHTPQ